MGGKQLHIINTRDNTDEVGVGILKARCIDDSGKDYEIHNLYGDLPSGIYDIQQIKENQGLNGNASFDIHLSSVDAHGIVSCPKDPVLTEFFIEDITTAPSSVLIEKAVMQGTIPRVERDAEISFYRGGI